MKRILIIEDDIRLRKYMKDFLSSYNFQVKLISNFNRVEEDVIDTSPDLILLDINLPKFDGFYFLKKIRKNFSIPIIIISARSEEHEQIRGMDLGADDYITKPFGVELLIAKINAVLRRIDGNKDRILKVKNAELICDNMSLKIDDKILGLSKNEYRLLRSFMINYNKVISREELLEELWDETTFVDDNTLTVNITRLKKRLREIKAGVSIVTKRGIGYVLQ